MSIDIINNGSFDNYAYWEAVNNANWSLTSQGCEISSEFSIVTDTVPPGIYQVLELADYKTRLSLEISFLAAHMDDDYTKSPKFDLHIFEITEYTKFPTGEIWTYELPTKCSDYIHKSEYRARSLGTYGWTECKKTVVLDPGYYILGITANTYLSSTGTGSVYYNQYISNELEPIVITNVSAKLTESEIVSRYDALVNGSFESINAPFDKWITKGVFATDYVNDSTYPCIANLGRYCKCLKADPSLDWTDILSIEDYGYGLNQVVDSDFNCNAEIKFWYRSSTGGYAYCYVYELSYYDEDSDYFSIESVVYENVAIHSANEWRYFQAFFNVEKGKKYMISIFPPEETANNGEFYVDNVAFEFFSKNYETTGHTGTFDNPYTEEDGSFSYYDYKTPSFIFYDGTYPPSSSYIYSDYEYYYTSSFRERLLVDGLYATKDPMYEGGTVQKYFFADGTMAVDEYVFHDAGVWIADHRGAISSEVIKIFDIQLDIGNTIDLLPDEEISIYAMFIGPYSPFAPDQTPPVALDVVSSDPNVVVITGLDVNPDAAPPNFDDIYEGLNSANLITIRGKSYGKSTITISHQNYDGTITKVKIDVYIRDPIEYEDKDNITLTILNSVNYVALNGVLNLKCLVQPVMSSYIPIDWISSDRKVAKINSKGEVTPIALGYSRITAKNYGSDKSDTCILYVVEQTVQPVLVKTSVESLSLDLGDETRITAELLNSDGNMEYVTQELAWTTSNAKIATVDDYGFVKGIAQGNVIITCASAQTPSIKKEIPVSVSGTSSALTDIKLNMNEVMLNYDDPYSREYLTYTLTPANTKETDVVWKSNNEDIVIVAENGMITPTYNSTGSAEITCTSVTNPLVYRTCKVRVVRDSEYFPTVVLSKDTIKTYIGATARLDYVVGYYYNIRKEATATITKPDGSGTLNTLLVRSDYILLNLVEEGEFIITVSCTHRLNVTTKTCRVFVYNSDEAPEFIKDLEVLYAMQNGSFVLRYYAEDAICEDLGHSITINNADYSITPKLCLYDNQKYFYYFGAGLPVGDYSAYITVADNSQDIVTDITFAQSNTVNFTIPDVVDKKTSLSEAKINYDIVKNDTLNYLYELMDDSLVYDEERAEFETRYLIFCALYDNLADILEICIDYINEKISNSQIEMATISETLASDGVSVAAYSEGDYTNSNYQSVTDMDYYQNECIKQLVARVLELEARLNELTNNNN